MLLEITAALIAEPVVPGKLLIAVRKALLTRPYQTKVLLYLVLLPSKYTWYKQHTKTTQTYTSRTRTPFAVQHVSLTPTYIPRGQQGETSSRDVVAMLTTCIIIAAYSSAAILVVR